MGSFNLTSSAHRAWSAFITLSAAAVSVLSVAGTASAATPADDYGAHVVSCVQSHGFDAEHNPGIHHGRSGWSPEHVC